MFFDPSRVVKSTATSSGDVAALNPANFWHPFRMPKLHAVLSENKKFTLQNAVTATDRQIDALANELEDEIKLVEGGQ